MLRLPAISGTAEQMIIASGCKALSLAAASAGVAMSCAAPPASWRRWTKATLTGPPTRSKFGIPGCSIFCCGAFLRIALRIVSRLVSMFAPICEVPLAETLLGKLGHCAVTPPRIECLVVQEKIRRVFERGPREIGQCTVLFGMSEYMPGHLKRRALC